MNLNDNFLISNDLLLARNNLTLNEMKIVFMLISEVGIFDTKIKTCKIKASDFAEICNMNKDNISKTLKKIQNEITKKRFFIPDENGNEKEYACVEKMFYEDGFWFIKLSDDLKPYLCNSAFSC